ncbi:MAG: hypothetical protein O3C45_10850 [Bacteroidetes bacterium]|nr:hypothetical protein [Bacteroidota bacterium]
MMVSKPDTDQERPDRLRLLLIGDKPTIVELVEAVGWRGDWDFRYEITEGTTFDVLLLCGYGNV